MDTTFIIALPETNPAFALALASHFGSVEGFAAALDGLARTHAASGGELRLDFGLQDGRLSLHASRDAAPVDGCETLLTIALPSDSPDRLKGLDLGPAYALYQAAVHAASAALAAHDVAGRRVIDVRRAGVFEAATTMLPETVWHDPLCVPAWAAQLPAGEPVLVYCVYGHEVGRATALRLHALGVDARFLEGGIDEWQRAGRVVVAKPAT
jgi:superoxide dismutase, Fe-Mn family